MPRQAKYTALVLLLTAAVVAGGCAATYTHMRYSDLKVQNRMSASIFLDPVAKAKRTVYVRVRNTSDRPFYIEREVKERLAASGYRVVDDPEKAHYWLQANILRVRKTDISALERAHGTAFGGPLIGAGLGALVARGDPGAGAAVGLIAGAVAETVTGTTTRLNIYVVITDVQISEASGHKVHERTESFLRQGISSHTEQSSAHTVHRKHYRTRVVSSARKVNLQFAEAYPALRQGLVQSISGLF